MATTTKVSNYLIGRTNRTRHPATMGCEWSLNMFREVNENVEYMASVPGLEHIKHIGDGRCRGAYVSTVGLASMNQQENAFVCFGRDIFRLDVTGEATKIGSVAGGTNRVIFAESGGISPYLLIADGFNLWAYDLINGGELLQCSLPQRVMGEEGSIRPTHVTVVHGSVVVNDAETGLVYYSIRYPLQSLQREVYLIENGEVVYDTDNPLKIAKTTVSSLDYMFLDDYGSPQFITTYTSSDAVKAVVGIGENLYLFGSKSIEVWQHGSTEASQTWVQKSYTTNADNGVQAPYTIAVCSSRLYYLGSGTSYAKGILMVEGTSFKKISEDWLDAKLLKETSESAYGYAFAVGNHNFYVLQLPTNGETWVYDSDTQEWHERASRNKETGIKQMWRPQMMIWFQEQFYAFCDDGWSYKHSEDYWYEDYADEMRIPMTRSRQGAMIVNDNRPFIFNELAVECNVGTWDEYGLEPKLLLEVSADGGNSWGNVRQASLGLSGQFSHRVRFHGLGRNRLCVLRVTYSHPTSLELTVVSQRVTPTSAVI